MKIQFHDNHGTHETVYFNPSISFYSDGSLVIHDSIAYIGSKEYRMPLFAGESDIVWADFKHCRYNNGELGNAPNAVKIVWVKGNTLHFVRYKETLVTDSFFKKLLRRFHVFP